MSKIEKKGNKKIVAKAKELKRVINMHRYMHKIKETVHSTVSKYR